MKLVSGNAKTQVQVSLSTKSPFLTTINTDKDNDNNNTVCRHTKHFTYICNYNTCPYTITRTLVLIIPILQVKRLRHREAKWHVQGHIAPQVPELRHKPKQSGLRGPVLYHPSYLTPLLLIMIQDNSFEWELFFSRTLILSFNVKTYYYFFDPRLPGNCQGHSRRHKSFSSRNFQSLPGWDSMSSRYLPSPSQTPALC